MPLTCGKREGDARTLWVRVYIATGILPRDRKISMATSATFPIGIYLVNCSHYRWEKGVIAHLEIHLRNHAQEVPPPVAETLLAGRRCFNTGGELDTLSSHFCIFHTVNSILVCTDTLTE